MAVSIRYRIFLLILWQVMVRSLNRVGEGFDLDKVGDEGEEKGDLILWNPTEIIIS